MPNTSNDTTTPAHTPDITATLAKTAGHNVKLAGVQLSGLDHLILGVDRALRTLSPGSISAERRSPAHGVDESSPAAGKFAQLQTTRQHIGGLMRINHTGEVCAQALYQGQALTARNNATRSAMQESANEEEDHLAWCEERLQQLDSRPSYLNPLFYGLSFGLGALAGAAGDKWSLGFIAATEEQVCQHLREHLAQVPANDKKTRAILEQMLVDEEHHGAVALRAGGINFPGLPKKIMTAVSRLMTSATYKL